MTLPPSHINTLLFDLDGTLVDTEQAAAAAIGDCFKRWHVDITADDAAYVTGRTWASAFEFLSKKYRLPVTPEQAADEMMQAYRSALEHHLKIVPGGAAAVRALSSSGHFELALVSGSNRAEILWCLDKLGIRAHFKVILGAEDYPNSKPAPDGYLKALKLLGREPQRTLIFEDSQAGIASAIAAGAWVVAINGTNHFKQDTSRAHHHIEDLTGVSADWVHAIAPQLVTRKQ